MLRSILQLVLLVCIAALPACASTSLDNTWKDPKYSGGPTSKIVVVGISNQASVRRAFEDTFAQALTKQGVQAVASYTLIPEDGQIPEGALRKAVEQTGADSVLITRMMSKHNDVVIVPTAVTPPALNTRAGYNSFYTGAWTGHYEPTTVYTTDHVITETTLFRTDAPEPVWSATSRTQEPRDVAYATQDFAKAMIAALRKEGLI